MTSLVRSIWSALLTYTYFQYWAAGLHSQVSLCTTTIRKSAEDKASNACNESDHVGGCTQASYLQFLARFLVAFFRLYSSKGHPHSAVPSNHLRVSAVLWVFLFSVRCRFSFLCCSRVWGNHAERAPLVNLFTRQVTIRVHPQAKCNPVTDLRRSVSVARAHAELRRKRQGITEYKESISDDSGEEVPHAVLMKVAVEENT